MTTTNVINKKVFKPVDNRVPCMRCKGRKIMYRVGSGYCMENMGGKQVNCPMCLGEGKIKPLSEILKATSISAEELQVPGGFIEALAKKHDELTEADIEQMSKELEPGSDESYAAMSESLSEGLVCRSVKKTKTESKSKGGSSAKEKSRTAKA